MRSTPLIPLTRRIFLVFEFVEHDLKTLLSTMRTPFLASEVKTLMLQLLSAIAFCHDNWIVHRDLKTCVRLPSLSSRRAEATCS